MKDESGKPVGAEPTTPDWAEPVTQARQVVSSPVDRSHLDKFPGRPPATAGDPSGAGKSNLVEALAASRAFPCDRAASLNGRSGISFTAEDAESAEGPSLLAIIAVLLSTTILHRSTGLMNALLSLRSSATSAVGLRCFGRSGAAGALILGPTGRATVPVLGCTLLVDSPVLFLNIVLGSVLGLGGNGSLDLPPPVPCTAPIGLILNAQAGLLDWAAPKGLSMSNGLEVMVY